MGDSPSTSLEHVDKASFDDLLKYIRNVRGYYACVKLLEGDRGSCPFGLAEWLVQQTCSSF